MRANQDAGQGRGGSRRRIDVILEIGEGLPHVYQLMLGTPEAAGATEQTGEFLRAGSVTRPSIGSCERQSSDAS
jgi:hypothetical protein